MSDDDQGGGEDRESVAAAHPVGDWRSDPEGRHELRYFVHDQPTDLVSDSGLESVDEHAEWRPDPTGRHEFRYFVRGEATHAVSDGGVQSTDPPSAQPPRSPLGKSRRTLVTMAAVCAAVLVVAVVVVVVVIRSGSSEETIQEYGDRVQPVYDEMNDSLNDLQAEGQTAADSGDLYEYGRACDRVHDANEAVEETLPTPDDDLTTDIESAVYAFDRSTHYCTMAIESVDSELFDESFRYVEQGFGHWQDATERLQELNQ